jgi:ATP-dependent RNA helicase DDX6/DHH1
LLDDGQRLRRKQQGSELRPAIANQSMPAASKDIKATKYKSFNELKLKENIILALTEAGYLVPSPIQEESIPLITARKSIIARAKNGTGKTGGFLIPLLNEID